MIGVRVDDDFLAEIDRVRGSMSRSDFVRRAAFEALKSAGSMLPESVTASPDRAGKGGRPKQTPVENFTALVSEQKTEYKTKKKPKNEN